MNDRVFLQANKVFLGHLRDNKEKGLDISKPRQSIEKEDMEKLFNNYFAPGIANMNTKVLMHKVFFDIVYYTGHRGKEGLRSLNKTSFEIKTGTNGQEYVEVTFNEKSKKNQGHENSSAQAALHNDHHIISAQPDNPLCPVESFKNYIARLNHECDAFFQYYSNDLTQYDNKPIGKNSLATMMKEISEDANLSRKYTNHCIRKTMVTALHRQGFELSEIQNVTKHKNLDSLKHYVDKPTYKEKKSYNEALLSYAEVDENSLESRPKRNMRDVKPAKAQKKNDTKVPTSTAVTSVVPNNDKMDMDNCLIPVIPEETNQNATPSLATSQSNVMNTMQQALNLFQNATFNNCNFTFQMPK